MVDRARVPYRDYTISVVTEQLGADRWASTATVIHDSGRGEEFIPILLEDRTFGDEAEARDTALRTARAWVDANAPALS